MNLNENGEKKMESKHYTVNIDLVTGQSIWKKFTDFEVFKDTVDRLRVNFGKNAKVVIGEVDQPESLTLVDMKHVVAINCNSFIHRAIPHEEGPYNLPTEAEPPLPEPSLFGSSDVATPEEAEDGEPAANPATETETEAPAASSFPGA